MKDVVVVSAVRTAVGKLGGALKDMPAEDLAAVVIREAINRAGVQDSAVDEVIFGQSKQSSDAPNVARVAALKARLDVAVTGYTVHRQCGSGMQSLHSAVQAIATDMAEIVVAGGVESMSTAPYYLRSARFGYGSGNGLLLDPNTESQPRSQPIEIYGSFSMGMTAENLAQRYGITREEQDHFAYESQQKALAAIAGGRFAEEIIPLTVPQRKGPPVPFGVDEHPRQTTLEALAKLPPVFKEGGTVTAGNSSGRNDGASATVVMSAEKAVALGLQPLARVVSMAVAGVSPEFMGIGPVLATQLALKRAGLRLEDLEVVELNEAFAAQSLAVLRELKVDPARVNPNGGAIALGHAIGNSGARIIVTLLHELKRRGVRYGLATLCIAGGMGIATIFENLK